MSIKFLAVALVAVLSVQGLVQAYHVNINVHGKPEGGDLDKLVAESKSTVTTTIVDAIASLKRTYDQVMVIAQQKLNKSMMEIDQIKKQAIADIKEIEKANKERVPYADIKECVEAQLPRIEALARKTQQGVSECFSGIVAEFTNMYENLLEATSAAYDNIFALVVEFDECQDWNCRAEVAGKLVTETQRTAAEVRIILDRSMITMREQIPALVECMRTQIAYFKTEVAAIEADIKACVEASAPSKF